MEFDDENMKLPVAIVHYKDVAARKTSCRVARPSCAPLEFQAPLSGDYNHDSASIPRPFERETQED